MRSNLGEDDRLYFLLRVKDDERLLERVTEFVESLDTPTFNQSAYKPLRCNPTGMFVVTKVDEKRRSEGRYQLGLWLAAWFGRVSEFPQPRSLQGSLESRKSQASVVSASASTPDRVDSLKEAAHVGNTPPFLPLLSAYCGAWQLYFAFDLESNFKIYRPISIGNTDGLLEAYRLHAVLRLLAGWVDGEFRSWVERRVGLER